MVQNAVIYIFPLLLLVAAIGDFMTMRIPNWLVLAVAATMVPAAFITGMPLESIMWHLITGGMVLIICFAMFSVNWMGGGDAKLIAAAALWIGWSNVLEFAIFTALAGGALALVMKLWQAIQIHHHVKGREFLGKIVSMKLDLPYGVAIAAGGIYVFPMTSWMAHVVKI